MLNRYLNPRSKRKLKAKAAVQAAILVKGAQALEVSASDEFLALERVTDPIKVESTTFKKNKPLKVKGGTASGTQTLVRGSVCLVYS